MLKSRLNTERLTVRLGIVFSRFGLSANTWTILSLVPAFIGFFALYQGDLLLAFICFLASGVMDAIDGAVARVTKSISNLGAFLDGVVDRYVELMLYVGLWFYVKDAPVILLDNSLWMILLVYGAIMPAFVKAYADHKRVVTEKDELREMSSLIERSERLNLLLLGMLLGLMNIEWLIYLIIVTAVLTNYTALQRIAYTLKRS